MKKLKATLSLAGLALLSLTVCKTRQRSAMQRLSGVAAFLLAYMIVVTQRANGRGTQEIPVSVIRAFTRQW
jgi:hypothetical protein